MEYLSFVLPFLAIVIVTYIRFRILSWLIQLLINWFKKKFKRRQSVDQSVDGSLS